MSDIEDYTYSPYDELEDLLYDADPAPELADDLADHAIHSPVFQDEDFIQSELQEYFSDWEYYSDDYMDDDPALLRKNPQVGTPPRRTAAECNKGMMPKRGKKRKLLETTAPSPLESDEAELLTRCIRGTVWARHKEHGPPTYKDGQDDKVALMKNWKEVFAVKDGGWSRSQEILRDDESWAKDMSLADMGLQNVQRQSSFEQGAEPGEEGSGDEVDGVDQDDYASDTSGKLLVETDTKLLGPVVAEPVSRELSTEGAIIAEEGLRDEDPPPKRRRLKEDPPSRPKSNDSLPRAMSKTYSASTAEGGDAARGSLTNGRDPGSRKRKASEEPDGAQSGLASAPANNRAKRVASTTARTDKNATSGTRTVRSNKKG